MVPPALGPPSADANGGGIDPTSTVLTDALAGYCADTNAGAAEGTEPPPSPLSSSSATAGQDASVVHLNAVLLHVQRRKRFEEVVAQMGPYLTSEKGRIRTKAAALLGEVLNRLPDLPLSDAAVHHYVEFFTSRLSDFPSVAGSLLALRALLQYHGGAARKEADVIATAVFKDVHVPSMTQTIRQRTFEVLYEMMDPLGGSGDADDQDVPASLHSMSAAFIRGLLDCVEGEKDPRCLILCLKVLSRTQAAFPAAADEHIEALFDVTACYFPITFTPPPNDPYGITPEMLSQALRDALTTRPPMAEFVLPLLVDKLTSTHVPAKLEALATLQMATGRYGVRAMRKNLPSLTAALFQEVVSCSEAAVVTQALETCRVLAAHLSNHGDESLQAKKRKTQAAVGEEKKKGPEEEKEEKDERAKAEADWQAFLHGTVTKGVAEVKVNPDSMIGRACARLLGEVARASVRAFAAVLKAAVPSALQLISGSKKTKPSLRLVEEGENGKQQAALLLLVELVDAVDPGLDFSASAEGPPLAPYVADIHKALLEHLGSPIPGPALLAVRGLASLATRSPSDLLAPAQSNALVALFTARLQAEERTVGPAYDPDLARALLQGLRTLSQRRPEHTAAVLSHTLPELLQWMDEATAAATSAGAKGNGVFVGSFSRTPELDRCLGALAFLAGQAEIFQAVVPSLLNRVMLPGPPAVLKGGEGTTHILSSLAKIFVSTSAANQAALPALLALPPPPTIAAAAKDEHAMEVESEEEASSTVTTTSPPSPCLWSLLTAILASAAQGQVLDDAALEAALRVFGAATEALPPILQDLLAVRLLRYFFPAMPASAFGGRDDDLPAPSVILGLHAVDPSAYPSQAQALAVLCTVLASLHVTSPLFASSGMKTTLFPALVQLTLLPSSSSSFSSSSLPEPACWGVALVVNKAADSVVDDAAVAQLLQGFQQRQQQADEATATRDLTSLIWLTKALALRCAPRKSMEEAVSLLIDVVGCGTAAEQGGGEDEEPSPARLALALQAAEGFGLILRDPDAASMAAASSLSDSLLAPRPTSARVNPLWRQRVFYVSFARLRQAVDRHRARPQAKAAALLAVCNMVGSLPKPIIQSELDPILLVVLQGMSSTATDSDVTLRARATETFAVLVKDSVEAVVPHLATVVPLLYRLCTPSDPHYLPKAKLRVLALESLLELTHLPYAKLHPYRAQVRRGLLVALDDKKRLVRQSAVKVRNEWMVME